MPDNIIHGVGRRKEASARVYLKVNGSGKIRVNGKPMEEYFPITRLQKAVKAPLALTKQESVSIKALVSGGGVRGQAEAIVLGIARALVKKDEQLRHDLKKEGFLRRDARVKERKKYGRKRARKGFQWTKR